MTQSVTPLNPIQLAIVSPCSTCKNQGDEPKDGHPPCPRRQHQKRQADLKAQNANTEHIDHLALTGHEEFEASDEDVANNALRNPVYWDSQKAVLIWVATLADNGGIPGPDLAKTRAKDFDPKTFDPSKPVCPHLLDPEFDTSYIQCHPLPVVPAADEAAYYSLGAFNEGEQVEVRFTHSQQLDLVQETGEDRHYEAVLIDGFAQRVHFAYLVPRKSVPKDHVAGGAA